jgi:hypothetical protein
MAEPSRFRIRVRAASSTSRNLEIWKSYGRVAFQELDGMKGSAEDRTSALIQYVPEIARSRIRADRVPRRILSATRGRATRASDRS